MKSAKKILISVIVLIFIIAVAFAIRYSQHISIYSLEYILKGFGSWSYVLFFLLCSFRSFLLLPCGFTSALGGLLFGSIKGTIITLIGYTIGGTIVFHLSRVLGKDWAREFIKNKAAVLEKMASQNSFLSIFVLRVVPILPFDAVSCIGGVSDVKWPDYVLATFLGSLPGVFLYVYFGETLKSLSLKQIIIPFCIIIFMSMISIGYKIIEKFKIRQKHT